MTFDLIPTPYGSVIFCDDIREEKSGKIILIGCYGSEIAIGSSLPTVLPQLCISCRLVFDVFSGSKPVEIKVAMPGEAFDTASMITPLNLDANDLLTWGAGPSDPDHPRYMSVINIIGNRIRLENDGLIQVFLTFEGKTLRIGVIKVKSGQPRTTSSGRMKKSQRTD